jgi:hypothetical protein
MSEDELIGLIRRTLHLWVSEEMGENPDSDVSYGQRFEEHSDSFMAYFKEQFGDQS